MQHVVIVGGGFSGTMTAINLARLSQNPLRVTLVNHGYPQGRGIAYSARRPEHLLNVAARNMSALPDHPNHFVEWLRTRVEFSDTPESQLRETFMPRRVYGDYLKGLFEGFARPIGWRSQVEITVRDAEAIDVIPEKAQARVVLAHGEDPIA